MNHNEASHNLASIVVGQIPSTINAFGTQMFETKRAVQGLLKQMVS